jgi:hypothetical protein
VSRARQKAIETLGVVAAMALALRSPLIPSVAHACAYVILVLAMGFVAWSVRPKQPTTTIVWMVGAVSLAARAYGGGTTLDPRFLACLALGLAFTLILLAGGGDGAETSTLLQRVSHRFFYVATAVGVFFAGNQVLDFRDATKEITSVSGTRALRTGSPFAQYRLTLKAWDPEAPWTEREFQVDEHAYASLTAGDPVDVDVRPGAFGSSWVSKVERAPDE